MGKVSNNVRKIFSSCFPFLIKEEQEEQEVQEHLILRNQ